MNCALESKSGLSRNVSRAKEAMEKHKERMRKSQQQLSSPGISRTSSFKNKKLEKNTNMKNETFHCGNEPLKKRKEVKKNCLVTKVNHLASVETSHATDHLNVQNGFDKLDIKSPMIKRRIPNRGNMKKQKKGSTTRHKSFQKSKSADALLDDSTNDQKNRSQSKTFSDLGNFERSSSIGSDQFTAKKSKTMNDVKRLEGSDKIFLSVKSSSTFPLSREKVIKKSAVNESKTSHESEKQRNSTDLIVDDNAFPDKAVSSQNFDPSLSVAKCGSINNETRICGSTSKHPKTGNTFEKKETTKSNKVKKRNTREKIKDQNEEGSISACNASRDIERTLTEQNSKLRTNRLHHSEPEHTVVNKQDFGGVFLLNRQEEVKEKKLEKGVVSQKNDTMSIQSPIVNSNFRGLSTIQRRDRLRQAFLKYKEEIDEDSPLSDDSDVDDNNIDMDWLEKEKETITPFDEEKWLSLTSNYSSSTRENKKIVNKANLAPMKDSQKVKKSKSLRVRSSTDRQAPELGNVKTIYEIKTEMVSNENPSQSFPESTISANLNEADAINEKNEESDSKTQENGDIPNVGSMRSMWENRKAQRHSAFDATSDEAFDSSTMGRLKGAKALFENMSRNNNKPSYSSSFRLKKNNPEESPTIDNVKNIFENNAKAANAVKRSQSMKVQSQNSLSLSATAKEKNKSNGFDNRNSVVSEKTAKRNSVHDVSGTQSSDDWLDDVGSDSEVLSSNTSEDDDETKRNDVKSKKFANLNHKNNVEDQKKNNHPSQPIRAWEET